MARSAAETQSVELHLHPGYVSALFDFICAPNEHERTTSLVRPQPQTSFFLILTFGLLSTLVCPFVRLSGDLSKVQWPAGLHDLNLGWTGVWGASLAPFRDFMRLTNFHLVRPQP